MRIIILSDLHITSDSNYDSIPWVNNLCSFIKNGKYYADTLIVVLGDIIDNDGKNSEIAFEAADRIFSYIKAKFSTVNYKIAFVPGNHDYCNGNLNTFDRFCRRHQTASPETFVFSDRTTFNMPMGDINLIFTDSIQKKDYGIPGQLDLESIRSCILPDKENLLFMHHSLLFEDLSDHTGIIQQPAALNFLKQHGIKFVFHGHAHAMRNYEVNGNCRLFGVGSIGVEDPGIDNEKEQFLEVQVSGKCIEAVVNWLWRGGDGKYREYCIYPDSSRNYGSGEMIPYFPYEEPEDYIERYVLPYDIASQDEVTRYFALDKKTTLFDACMEEQLVLLIADAGLGKSVEMQHLAHVVTSEKSYLRPVYLSLNEYEGESIEDYLFIRVPKYKTLDPNRFVLILDGYDELPNPDAFKRALSRYIAANSKTLVCISMRSNFLAANASVFKDFSVYQLLELRRSDIELELKKHHIDKQAFYVECMQRGLSILLSNPFYLRKIIEIFLSDGLLPNQSGLIARFINIQFLKDAEKFEYASRIDDSCYEIERALTRFAYGMQLLGCSSCNKSTFESILEKKDRQLIKYSSLTMVNSSGHSFSHNIFKEYLVAKYVSNLDLEKVIKHISIPGTKYLNPNWFNVLGLILQLNSCEELESWVLEAEPLALTKLETDRVNPKLRYSILAGTLDSIISKNIWFRNEICSEKQLASFVQSPEAVDLLVSHIEVPTHFRSLYFCLSVLLKFTDLYEKDNKVRQVLVACYQSSSIRSHEKRVAISAIATLKLNNPEITDDLIHRFTGSASSYERLGVYEYLLQSHQCDKNTDFLLAGIKYLSYSHQDNEIPNGTEHFTLIECLNNISAPGAIEKVIKWYSHEEHMGIDFFDREGLFSSILDKAANAYCYGHHLLFDAVYNFFINATRQYSRYHIPDAIKFFSTTGTLEKAFRQLVSEGADDRLFMIDDTIQAQPELLDVFFRLYSDDKLCDDNLFKKYTLRHQGNSTIFEKCAETIRIKTGEVLDPPKQLPDYDLQRRKDVQVFFDSLFDPQAMHTLLVQIADFYGNREITFEQLQKSRKWQEYYPDGTYSMEIILRQSGFKKERVIDFIDLINWDNFFINRICYLFKNENTLVSLVISEQQRNRVKRVYHQLEKKLDYNNACKELGLNRYSFSRDLQCYMIIKDALNFPSPDDYYQGLLEIPCAFLNKQSNVGKKYDLIEQYITPHNVALRVEELTLKETRIRVLDDLMYGCKRYKIKSCRDTAIQMCKRNELTSYDRKNALEYLLVVFGSDLILDEIMPTVDNALFEIIVEMLRKTADNRLKEEIMKRYRIEPSHFLLKNLIALNVPEGLEYYIKLSKNVNGVPDDSDGIGEVTEAISTIYDVSLLPLLLDVVRMRFADSFKDASFHSLYNSLQNALSNCAKSNFTLVWKSIDALKAELSQNIEAISFCNVLQANILEENKMLRIKKWSVQDVRKVLYNID